MPRSSPPSALRRLACATSTERRAATAAGGALRWGVCRVWGGGGAPGAWANCRGSQQAECGVSCLLSGRWGRGCALHTRACGATPARCHWQCEVRARHFAPSVGTARRSGGCSVDCVCVNLLVSLISLPAASLARPLPHIPRPLPSHDPCLPAGGIPRTTPACMLVASALPNRLWGLHPCAVHTRSCTSQPCTFVGCLGGRALSRDHWLLLGAVGRGGAPLALPPLGGRPSRAPWHAGG